jgi:hypothetical protein
MGGPTYVPGAFILNQFLSLGGDGTGTADFIGDFSTPDEAYIQAPAGKVYIIHRMLVLVEDGVGMRAERYGTLSGALGNGLVLEHKDDNRVYTDFTPSPLTHNAQWGGYCYDVDVKAWGAGNEVLVARWTFSKSGQAVELNGDGENQRLAMTLQDNFTGLVSHTFLVQGHVIPSSQARNTKWQRYI